MRQSRLAWSRDKKCVVISVWVVVVRPGGGDCVVYWWEGYQKHSPEDQHCPVNTLPTTLTITPLLSPA